MRVKIIVLEDEELAAKADGERRGKFSREPHETCEPISSKWRGEVYAASRPYDANVSKGGQKAGYFRVGSMGRRFDVVRGGWEAGKSTGFSHLATRFYRLGMALIRLFPHKSAQVVDFPHLAYVSLFLRETKNGRILVRGMAGRGMGSRRRDGASPEAK